MQAEVEREIESEGASPLMHVRRLYLQPPKAAPISSANEAALVAEFRVPFRVQPGQQRDHPRHELITLRNSVHERCHVFRVQQSPAGNDTE